MFYTRYISGPCIAANFASLVIKQFMLMASLLHFDGSGGFAEQVKRKAPVTGPMRRGEIDVVDYARAIEGAGVAAIAVNTDRNFFGCTYEDLTSIRVSRAPFLLHRETENASCHGGIAQ